MRLDGWTLALQTINVLGLMWLLKRFLFQPVLEVIAARQASANQLLADAQAAKAQAEAEARELKASNDDFAAQAARQREQSQAAAEAERQRLLARAKTEAEAILEQGHAAVNAERSRLAAQWQGTAAELATRMATTLLARLPAQLTTAAMTEALQARIATLSEADRRSLTADGPATLVTPAPLAADAQAALVRALGEWLPNTTPPVFAVDATLIAGAELRAPHVLIRNSWRADLDAMLTTLKEDDHARLV